MILTSKCRKDFNHWRFEIKKQNRKYVPYNDLVIRSLIIDFFDQNRILIDVHPCLHVDEIGGDTVNEFHFFVTVADMDNVNADYPEEDEEHYFKERIEAQEFGIKWANRIYNLKHN